MLLSELTYKSKYNFAVYTTQIVGEHMSRDSCVPGSGVLCSDVMLRPRSAVVRMVILVCNKVLRGPLPARAINEVSQCPEKAPTMAFSLLKVFSCAFTKS